MISIEGRHAYEPVDSLLSLQVAVGVVAIVLHDRALDAGLLAGRGVQHGALEAPALGPSQVHPHQHLRPVLRLHPAGAGVYGDYGVPSVVLAGERQPQLQFIQLLGKLRDLLGQCVLQGVIPLFERERDEPIYGLGLRLQTPPELDVFLVT